MFSCAASTVIGKATLPQFVSSVVFNQPLKSELCMQSLVHRSQVVVVQRLVKKIKRQLRCKATTYALCLAIEKGHFSHDDPLYGMLVNS